MTSSFISLNHTLCPQESTGIALSDRGFLFGDGLFETMRVSHGKVPLLSRHYERLRYGCDVLCLPVPDFLTIQRDINTLLHANQLTEGSVRLSLSRGSGPRGLTPPQHPHPTLLITASPAPKSSSQAVRLFISQHCRDERSTLSSIKSLNALPGILARLDAQKHGADDALMLNYRGYIAEASSATFLAYVGENLVTPPLSDGVLPGISRARLLEADLCHEQTLHPKNIHSYHGAWLLTALSLTPVSAINAHTLPLCSEITHRLQSFLYDHTSKT